MTHRPATFATLLGLTRAASAVGDFWIQDDFCAWVKGASDDHPVTYVNPATEELNGDLDDDEDIVCTVHGPNTDEDQEDDPEGRADLEEQFAAAVRE